MLAIHPMNDKDGLHDTKPGEAYMLSSSASLPRGEGIGKMLLQWAEAKAREHGCRMLTLSVLNGNAARRLYERFGFVAERATRVRTPSEAVSSSLSAGRMAFATRITEPQI